jgi:hypothetical protein
MRSPYLLVTTTLLVVSSACVGGKIAGDQGTQGTGDQAQGGAGGGGPSSSAGASSGASLPPPPGPDASATAPPASVLEACGPRGQWSVSAPESIAPALVTVSALLVDAAGVVVVTTAPPTDGIGQDSIQAAPFGGALAKLYAGPTYFVDYGLTADAQSAYFYGVAYDPPNNNNPSHPTGILVVPRAGGATAVVDQDTPSGPLFQTGSALYTDASDPRYYVPSLMTVAKAGGTPSYFYAPPNQNVIMGLAFEGTSFTWIEGPETTPDFSAAPMIIRTMALGAGTPDQVASFTMDLNASQVAAIGASNGVVAFVEGTSEYGSASAANGLYTVTAGGTPQLVDPQGKTPMLVDGGRVYYVSHGELQRRDLASGAVATLAVGADGTTVTNLAAYGGDLYVATQQCVVKLPR